MGLKRRSVLPPLHDPCSPPDGRSDPRQWGLFGVDARGNEHLLDSHSQGGTRLRSDLTTPSPTSSLSSSGPQSCVLAGPSARERSPWGCDRWAWRDFEVRQVQREIERELRMPRSPERTFRRFRLRIRGNNGENATQLGQIALVEEVYPPYDRTSPPLVPPPSLLTVAAPRPCSPSMAPRWLLSGRSSRTARSPTTCAHPQPRSAPPPTQTL
jgi:hypothetical protein